jgi:hypothetical protein
LLDFVRRVLPRFTVAFIAASLQMDRCCNPAITRKREKRSNRMLRAFK